MIRVRKNYTPRGLSTFVMQDDNGGDTDNMEKGAHEIFKVGIKIPPFLPNRPALWFAQLEGQFCLAGITSDTTKFYNATSQLDPQFAIEVADIIESPPKDNKYQTLKAELIRRLSKPREEEIRQFLDNQELGTRKPSQFLRHLQHLAGPQVPDEFIRSAWHNRLPNNIQPIIASHMDMPLEKLAELADKIIAIAAPTPPNVYAATSSSANQHAGNPPDHYLTALESLARQVNELTKQVASLSMHNSRSSRSPQRRYNRSRSHSRSTQRWKENKMNSVCYYHRKFGENAIKCLTPCSYKTLNANGSL